MKVILVNRKIIGVAAFIICCAVLTGIVANPAVIGASSSKRQLPIYSVQREFNVASLTFDAAWGNEDTQQLIDILGEYNVKATFFVVGDWARKYPESVKALSDAGHEIMNHSNKHAHMPTLSRDDIIADINACNDSIESVTGIRPTLFRPPYGDYDDKLITTIKSMNMYTIQWDVDSLDWKDLSAADIQKRVIGRVKPGSIVLFHNAAKNTPEALPGIIKELIKNGYSLVPVSQLIHKGEYTLDHTGKQIPVREPAA